MTAIGVGELAIGLGVIFLLEIVIFWAASAVADAPPMGWGKLLLVVLLVTVLSVALTATIGAYSVAMQAPLDTEQITLALMTGGFSLVVLWANPVVVFSQLAVLWVVPAVVYPMLASVSIPRGMWLALLQLLLRGFLYVFIAALVMVVLAVIQIFTGTDTRTELLDLLPVLV